MVIVGTRLMPEGKFKVNLDPVNNPRLTILK